MTAIDTAPTITKSCGTISGYQQHRNRNERACDQCRRARTEYDRCYRAVRRAAKKWGDL